MSIITSSSNQFFNPPNPLVSHVAMIQNIPNPDQVQYMTYTHSIAWTFNKENKRKIKLYNIIIYSNSRQN